MLFLSFLFFDFSSLHLDGPNYLSLTVHNLKEMAIIGPGPHPAPPQQFHIQLVTYPFAYCPIMQVLIIKLMICMETLLRCIQNTLLVPLQNFLLSYKSIYLHIWHISLIFVYKQNIDFGEKTFCTILRCDKFYTTRSVKYLNFISQNLAFILYSCFIPLFNLSPCFACTRRILITSPKQFFYPPGSPGSLAASTNRSLTS